MKRKVIYISGPYTLGDVAVNVTNAIRTANELINEGYTPICPHLSHFLHMHCPQPYDTWMEIDFDLVHLSDAVLRIPGESKGADEEVQLAQRLHKPIFHNIRDLNNFYRDE